MEIYKGISRQKAKQIISHSQFVLNGENINHHPLQMLEKGSILEIISLEKTGIGSSIPTGKKPVVICFEDDSLIIAIKPAGILSCGNKELSVNNSYHKLLENYISTRDRKKTRLWIVHRLDREVEGLLMFAKSEKTQRLIKNGWERVTKKYLALTENRPDPSEGIIENWLREGPKQTVITSQREVPGSRISRTEYRYVKTEKSYHLLEILLHTGRRNQIRVHLAGMGCPIVGDRKYGADAEVVRQIRLAAVMLEFEHPMSHKRIAVSYKPSQRFFRPSKSSDEKYKIL